MLNIVLCTDERYAPYCAVVMITALAHAANPENFNFLILNSGLPDTTQRAFRTMVQRFGANVDFTVADQALSEDMELGRFGVATLMRLYMHRYLPADTRRVVYLDCDLLVLGDLAELWQFNLEGKPIAAVSDLCSPATYAQRPQANNYFNAGVLLVDLEKWRHDAIGERSLTSLAEQFDESPFLDQDALNRIVGHDWLSLPLAWNSQPAVYAALEKNYDYLRCRKTELEHAVRHPKIVHFIGGVKPWHAQCVHPLQPEFIHFSQQTPWPIEWDALLAELSWKQRVRLAFKRLKARRRRKLVSYRKPTRR